MSCSPSILAPFLTNHPCCSLSHGDASEVSYYEPWGYRMFQNIYFNVSTLWICSASFRLCVEGGNLHQNTVKYVMSVFTQGLRCVETPLRAGRLLMCFVCLKSTGTWNAFSLRRTSVWLKMKPRSMRDKICLPPLWLIHYESITRTIEFL